MIPTRNRWVMGVVVVTLLGGLGIWLASRAARDGDGGVAPSAASDSAAAALEKLGDRPQVEVLNAGGVPGLARQATEFLRQRGFDVVYFGNADDFQEDSTVVIARTPDPAAARRVARAMGVTRLRVEPKPDLYVDATVRLGRDWPRGEAEGEREGGVTSKLKRIVPGGD